MKNKKMFTVLLLIGIAVVIAGIYFIRNHSTSQETKSQESGNVESQMSATGSKTENADTADTVTDADFSLAVTEMIDYEALVSYGLPVIVDYGSDSCIPCKEMAPVLEKMNEEMQGRAFIKFADVWKHTDVAGNVPVQVIPTQVLVNGDGTPFVPSEELSAEIEFVMYSDKKTGEHIFTVHQGGITEEQMRMILKEMGVL